jgi:hypothetical protein
VYDRLLNRSCIAHWLNASTHRIVCIEWSCVARDNHILLHYHFHLIGSLGWLSGSSGWAVRRTGYSVLRTPSKYSVLEQCEVCQHLPFTRRDFWAYVRALDCLHLSHMDTREYTWYGIYTYMFYSDGPVLALWSQQCINVVFSLYSSTRSTPQVYSYSATK